ncbi:MAG: CapA family protein [Eubacterium sp.]|nr:CapA family protein [Eubacterium sp.]
MDERQRRREIERRKQMRRKRRIKAYIYRAIFLAVIIAILVVCVKVVKHIVDNRKEQQVASSQLNNHEPDANEDMIAGDIVTDMDTENTESDTITATILSAGDVIIHDPFVTSEFYKTADGGYDYTSVLAYVKEDYENADFAVVNMESNICDNDFGGYPKFRAPEGIATSLYNNGIDMCILANNHFYDNGHAGLISTMEYLAENKLIYLGAQLSPSDTTYHIQEINGIKVGFFNYTYANGNDSQLATNNHPVDPADAKIINYFDYGNLDKLYHELESGLTEMEDAGVEYTVAYIHWGEEYALEENNTQHKIAAKLCELGIDALIGGHPHVVQPVDVITNDAGDHEMLCVYSVGNHFSNQRRERMDTLKTGHTEDGLMVTLTLEKDDAGKVTLVDTDFVPTYMYKTTENGDEEFLLLPIHNLEQLVDEVIGYDIESDVTESLKRTNAIISDGIDKVEAALPLS